MALQAPALGKMLFRGPGRGFMIAGGAAGCRLPAASRRQNTNSEW